MPLARCTRRKASRHDEAGSSQIQPGRADQKTPAYQKCRKPRSLKQEGPKPNKMYGWVLREFPPNNTSRVRQKKKKTNNCFRKEASLTERKSLNRPKPFGERTQFLQTIVHHSVPSFFKPNKNGNKTEILQPSPPSPLPPSPLHSTSPPPFDRPSSPPPPTPFEPPKKGPQGVDLASEAAPLDAEADVHLADFRPSGSFLRYPGSSFLLLAGAFL